MRAIEDTKIDDEFGGVAILDLQLAHKLLEKLDHPLLLSTLIHFSSVSGDTLKTPIMLPFEFSVPCLELTFGQSKALVLTLHLSQKLHHSWSDLKVRDSV